MLGLVVCLRLCSTWKTGRLNETNLGRLEAGMTSSLSPPIPAAVNSYKSVHIGARRNYWVCPRGDENASKSKIHIKLCKKLKNVSCEYDRVNGWNSTLEAAWYIRHVRICQPASVPAFPNVASLTSPTSLNRKHGSCAILIASIYRGTPQLLSYTEYTFIHSFITSYHEDGVHSSTPQRPEPAQSTSIQRGVFPSTASKSSEST